MIYEQIRGHTTTSAKMWLGFMMIFAIITLVIAATHGALWVPILGMGVSAGLWVTA